MVEKKLFANVTLRVDRTQLPPTPHSIRPREEERLRIFRDVIELMQLGAIPVSYAYSVPEQSAIVGFMRREVEQVEIPNVREVKEIEPEDRIRQLLRELSILMRDPQTLQIDSRGYLNDGGLLLRHAPLIEWYQGLERLGRNAIPESRDGAAYFFSTIVSIDGEDWQIPALPLEEFRDRINRISKGQWPTEVVEGHKKKSYGITPEPDGNQPSSATAEEEKGTNSDSAGDNEKPKPQTIRLIRLILVAQARDGLYYHVPDKINSSMLPAKFEVSRKSPRIGSLYDMTEVDIMGYHQELKFQN